MNDLGWWLITFVILGIILGFAVIGAVTKLEWVIAYFLR